MYRVWDTNGSNVLAMFWGWRYLFNIYCLPGRCLAPGPLSGPPFPFMSNGDKSFVIRWEDE